MRGPVGFSHPRIKINLECIRKGTEIIQAALRRPAVRVEFDRGIDRLRGTTFDGDFKLVSYFYSRQPYLGVKPVEIVPPQEGESRFALTAHAFKDPEVEELDKIFPRIEPSLGETHLFYQYNREKLPGSIWDEGMGLDEIFYQRNIDPLIADEVSRLGPEAGDLICDPACGTGRNFMVLKMRHPQASFIGSDKNESVVQLASQMHANIPIHLADARNLDHLEPGSVAIFILSGLLNETVSTPEEGRAIIEEVKSKSRADAHFIITGKTTPLFRTKQLAEMGFRTLLTTKWINQTFFPFYLCNFA